MVVLEFTSYQGQDRQLLEESPITKALKYGSGRRVGLGVGFDDSQSDAFIVELKVSVDEFTTTVIGEDFFNSWNSLLCSEPQASANHRICYYPHSMGIDLLSHMPLSNDELFNSEYAVLLNVEEGFVAFLMYHTGINHLF